MHSARHRTYKLLALPGQDNLNLDIAAVLDATHPSGDPVVILKNRTARPLPKLLPGVPDGGEPIRLGDDLNFQAHTASPAW